MIHLKQGVDFTHVHPLIVEAITCWDLLLESRGLPHATVTSFRDGNHMENSLHFQGRAADLRLPIPRDLTQPDYVPWLRNLVADYEEWIHSHLGQGLQVILEDDHLHIEWDPSETLNNRPPLP